MTAKNALTIHPKVAGAGLGFYLGVIAVYVADQFGYSAPADVQQAIIGTLTVFVGWLSPKYSNA